MDNSLNFISFTSKAIFYDKQNTDFMILKRLFNFCYPLSYMSNIK